MRSLLSDALVSLVRMHSRVVSRTYTLICTVSVVYMHLLYNIYIISESVRPGFGRHFIFDEVVSAGWLLNVE